MKNIFNKKDRGAVMLVAIVFFIVISSTIVFGLVTPVLKQVKIGQENNKSKQSYYLANSSLEDVVYRIKTGKQYSSTEYLFLNGSSATTTVTDVSGGKSVTTSASVNNDVRKIRADLTLGTGIAFHYGVQSGEGGFELQNSSSIIGNVYSNGPVIGSGNMIYGNVVSAGPAGIINGIHATGSAYAHTIQNSTVDKDAFYTSRTSTTVGGISYPGSPDQATTSLPISDAQIADWENDALAGGTISSPCPYVISSNTTIGPKVIDCDLEIRGNGIVVTLTGPIWVKGNFETKLTPTVRVDPSFGNKSIPIIADDPANRITGSKITLLNSSIFQGSGSSTSYIFLVSQNNDAETGGTNNAIIMRQGTGAMILYAAHGQITLEQSVNLKEVTAYKIIMQNTSQVTYDTGLPSTLFDSGPGGGFDITSWLEIP